MVHIQKSALLELQTKMKTHAISHKTCLISTFSQKLRIEEAKSRKKTKKR
jgi:hypothetical protein